jgi:hypothetical protein
MALEREEFKSWMELLRNDIAGVHERLDELNGRTRVVENKVAVLEDRGSRDTTARVQGLGGIVASAASFIYAWFRG